MKLKVIRWIAACMIVSVLCVGLLIQYKNTEKNTYSNAVFVEATNLVKSRCML